MRQKLPASLDPKAQGRKSKYTPALATAIGQRLGQGEPLTIICRDLGICDNTVRNWMEKDAAIAAAIARAREEGEQAITFRLRATARGKDALAGGDSTGDVQRDKLIIDTDLKLLAKWNPKKWGERQTIEHEGGITVHLDATDSKA